MNPEFIIIYKNLRFILVYLADLLSFLIFIVLFFKITPKSFQHRIKKIRPSWVSFKNQNFTKGVIGFLVVIFVFLAILSKFFILPSYRLYSKTKNIINLSQDTFGLLKSRDFIQAKKKLELIKEEVNLAKENLQSLSWMHTFPLVKNYYSDINSLFDATDYGVDSGLIAVDILPTLNSTSLEKIDEVSPQLEKIINNFSLAKKQIDKIDPKHYPKKIGNRPIREKIILVKNQIEQLEETKQAFQPLMNIIPDLIGAKEPKRYLILFQDDNKLRPTGGEITSFGIFKIDKGKIFPEGSGDIADLDQSLFNLTTAPPIISRYLGTNFLYLRDANISPDFTISMRDFEKIYQNSYRRTQIDGIIAIDGEFFMNMLKVLGPTVVYENTLSAENRFDCDCPAIIEDIGKLIKENRRRDIIGIFLNAILVKSYTSPVKTQFEIFLAISKSARQKDLLVYINDPEQQKAIEAAGIAGHITEYEGDYLLINEADFSENREDRYIKRIIEDKTDIQSGGEIIKNISLTYQKLTPVATTNSLTLRFYLPKGTEILEISTPKEKNLMTEDLGKIVLETTLEITPQSEKTVILKYRLPYRAGQGDYKLFRQKQPGVRGYEYTIFLNGEKRDSFFLENDQEIILTRSKDS